MSSNTKQVLAITLGSLGVVIGAFGMITAYNAKNAVDEESQVTTKVQEEFAAAQSRQDALESSQASKAEQLVAGLSNTEKGLAEKLNSNSRSIKQLRKSNRNLRQQVNSLSSQLTSLDKRQRNDSNELNDRVDRTNQRVSANTKSINQLRNRVGFDESVSP